MRHAHETCMTMSLETLRRTRLWAKREISRGSHELKASAHTTWCLAACIDLTIITRESLEVL